MTPTRRAIDIRLALMTLLVAAGSAAAQFNPFDIGGDQQEELFFDSRDAVAVSVQAQPEVAPGNDVAVAVVFDMDDGWHIWTNRPTDVPEDFSTFSGAIASAVTIEPVPHVTVHDLLQWPEMHGIEADLEGSGTPQKYAVYEGTAVVYVPITIAADAPEGPLSIPFKLTYQSCDDRSCKAPVYDQELTLNLTVTTSPAPFTPTAALSGFPGDLFARVHAGETGPELLRFDAFGRELSIDVSTGLGFALGLLIAALGGFLLNLTPCVLPVIPIKIMGLSRHAGNRRRTLMLGVVMAAGVVGFWLGLGVAIAGIAAFGSTNQLFQYPLFSIGLGVFIAVMAVGMCGLFSIQLPQFVYSVSPRQDSVAGSFGFGIMTAVLSTPCTAPFMGAAAGWAATKEPSITLMVFAAIGVGMASPYLVLSAFPHLVERMPRTGPASELIKQVMGLLMLAAAAYFVGLGLSGLLRNAADPPSRLYLWAVAACVIVAGIWLLWRTVKITTSPPRRIIFGGLGAVMVLVAAVLGYRLTDKGPIDWVYYTPERFAEARGAGEVVVMEFTAEWCLNCKALEESVLRSNRIAAALNGDGVTPIKVDLTGNAADGNAMLNSLDRVTIPLLVVFDTSGNEVFKSDYYTVEQVLTALRDAGAEQVALAR